MNLWIGVGGLVVAFIAAGARWKTERGWLDWVLSTLVFMGWMTAGQFLLMPLVPQGVLVAVMLGGITVGIFAAAIFGRRQADRAEAERQQAQRRVDGGEAVTPPGAA